MYYADHPNRATHRYKTPAKICTSGLFDGYRYVVSDSVTNVAISSGVDIEDIEVKNGDKWEACK